MTPIWEQKGMTRDEYIAQNKARNIAAQTRTTTPQRDTVREAETINKLGLDPSSITPDIEKDLFEATYNPDELSGLTDYKQLVKGQSRLAGQAQQRMGEAQSAYTSFKPEQMMGVLEEALRTKTDVGAQKLGTSDLFEKAGIPTSGIAGFTTLQQSLNQNSQAMQDRYGSFVNVLDKAGKFVGEENQKLADSYKFAVEQYNDERGRMDNMIQNIVQHEQAMALTERDLQSRKDWEEWSRELEPTAEEKAEWKEKGFTYVQGEYVPTGSFDAIFADIGNPDNDSFGECAYMSNRITTGSPGDKQWLGNMYEEKIGKVTHYDNPTIGDKLVTKTNMPYGHVRTVIDWNPETRNVQVVEWNLKGDGNMEVNEYNIDELSKFYSDTVAGKANWGFVEATLKSEIAESLQQITSGVTGELTAIEKVTVQDMVRNKLGQRAAKDPETLKTWENAYQEIGKDRDDLEDLLTYSGQSEQLTGVWRDVANNMLSDIPGTKTSQFMDGLDRFLEEGELGKATAYLEKWARSGADSSTRKKVEGNHATVKMLDNIKSDLESYEKAGGNTNIFTGKIEKIAERAGTVTDPELAKMALKIAKAVQSYRHEVSGAAFTESEVIEYKAMFPNIDNIKKLNFAKIDALDEILELELDTFYKLQIGDDYMNLKEQFIAPQQQSEQNIEQIKVQSPNGQFYLMSPEDAQQAVKEGGQIIQ